MSLPAIRPLPTSGAQGTARAARLMRALGPDASALWAELTPAEVRLLSGAMDELSEDASADAEAARLFSEAARRFSDAARPISDLAGQDVWRALSALPAETMADIVRAERPSVVALILSRLSSEAAARALRMLPSGLAVEAMRGLLAPGEAHAGAVRSLEAYLGRRLEALGAAAAASGPARVAQIFDRMDGGAEGVFLTALDTAEPGAGERVRALMFTFDDLAGLDAAGLQTLLASVSRPVLTTALKGAKEATVRAFFANMTQRAGELLREEMAALGPVRRSDAEAARHDIVALARELIQQGDIYPGGAGALIDDELIE
ncbi:FliG C-terminal domain-containing protein [Hyphomonas sp.]|uniref:FliG C-terminal domain-containing protein n=1 Tax=Hyphomonas sp. TaxID=87 RepID=UPI00391CC4BC